MNTFKLIAFVLIAALVFEPIALASAVVDPSAEVKFGALKNNEAWEGKVFLIGDVTVPYGMTLTIMPGTQLIFDDRDVMQGGQKKDQCELIVYGSVEALAVTDNPITMVSVSGLGSQKLVDPKQVAVLRFAPYTIDTESLRQEFNSFKYSYNILWAMIYIMWVFVRNMQ